MTTKDEFKELFLKLTEYTIPFGYEHTLEKYLPPGFKKDSFGNYFYEIGQSETLFTSHLDTFSNKFEKVNHIIDGYIIKTDEKTILGGDNKLGTAILINMIKERIPGTYYLTSGEEPLKSGGLYGSSSALNANPEFFKKFKRCIAFDRRGYGSIVTRQMGRNCCSIEFATKIAEGLQKISGIDWDKSGGFGYYTDTAIFMDTIPEVTNLSAGGFNEHHTSEAVNLSYTMAVLNFALKMKWESLPVIREIEKEEEKQKSNKFIKKYKIFNEEKIFNRIKIIMNIIDFSLTSDKYSQEGREIIFSRWLEDYDIKIILNGNDIIVDGVKMILNQFLNMILKYFTEIIYDKYNYYIEDKKIGQSKKIIKLFNCKNENEFFAKMGL